MCYLNFGFKTSFPGMVSILQSLLNSTLYTKNSPCVLVCFTSEKIIRALDEICNPSYTNFRSPRRFYTDRNRDKLFLFSLSSPTSFDLGLEAFPGFQLHKGMGPSLTLLPVTEEPAFTMEEPLSSNSEWTFAVIPAPGKCVSPS